MKIKAGFGTNIGCREVNQDRVFLKQFCADGENFLLTAVCDGIGGLEQGEAASDYLTQRMEEWFEKVVEWLDIGTAEPGILFAHLKDAVEDWNEGLIGLCREKEIRSGSTMSLLMILRDTCYCVQVGDSRVYRYLDSLEQLTEDDSVAREKDGRVKKYLANYMGKEHPLHFKTIERKLQTGEMFLICSDGFCHYFTEADAAEIYVDINRIGEAEKICRDRIDGMLRRGERDNISVVLVLVEA